MSTITQQQADHIAALYNSVIVAEMMKRKYMEGAKVDLNSYNVWHRSALRDVDELRERFGIKVIGYYDLTTGERTN